MRQQKKSRDACLDGVEKQCGQRRRLAIAIKRAEFGSSTILQSSLDRNAAVASANLRVKGKGHFSVL